MKRIIKSRIFLGTCCLLLGALIILAVRFVSYKPADRVHYHANFAVYINGKLEDFKDPFYYTEVEESCTATNDVLPSERAHMHDGVNNVVHVEDHAVTWGHFFQNIGWVVDPSVIRAADTIYMPDSQNKVSFILNGKPVENVVRTVIQDKDRLLVNFGDQSADQLTKEYKSIPATAAKYDTEQDPATCSGTKKVTVNDRLRHLF